MCCAQSCLTLCDPLDCSLPGSSVHENSPGKNTGVGCKLSSRGSSWLRAQTCISCLLNWQAGSLSLAPPGKPRLLVRVSQISTTSDGKEMCSQEDLQKKLGTQGNKILNSQIKSQVSSGNIDAGRISI